MSDTINSKIKEDKAPKIYTHPFPHLSDITLISNEGIHIKSGKLALSKASRVFGELFKDDPATEIKLDYTAQALSVVLWIIDGDEKFIPDYWTVPVLIQTLTFAHAYEIKEVEKFCHEKCECAMKDASAGLVLSLIDLACILKAPPIITHCEFWVKDHREETLSELARLSVPKSALIAIRALSSGQHWRDQFNKQLMDSFYDSPFASKGMSFHSFTKQLNFRA